MIVICPACHTDLIDESDLCSRCAEACASLCQCIVYERCEGCQTERDWSDPS